MKYILTAVAVLLLLTNVLAQRNPSVLKEYKKTFKTYGFSDPDPVARMGNIYPYYRFDGYTDKGVNKDWQVVEMENDFIKLMILPEVGGKIWGAWEKSTGKPFIYYNQVVKFRDVAMRGPWTSGGIEANYGIIGHTPNCATPVDYYTTKKDDGSVSCYIGTLDLLTQTYWTLEINLPKDKAYFTTRSFWYNQTPLEQSYYTWMNTGLKSAGNLEFIYPGTKYIGHGGEYADWNINKENGKDISFYEQNNFGGYKSYHVFGKYTEFFGAYWHDDHFGMGRYSTHDEKAGKKIWIWGLSGQGMIWEKLLSDTDGQYVEVQSGRMFNQAAGESSFTPFKHIGFPPANTDSWTEYWFPVMDTKGFVKANPSGALNLQLARNFLKINFSPLQDMQEELSIYDGERLVYSKKVDFKTLQVFSDSVLFSGKGDNLIVRLGQHAMEYRSNPDDGVLSRPVDSPKDFDWNSVYGLYLQGRENIQQRFYAAAENKLMSCLAQDPNFAPALVDMAMLMYRNLNYEKAMVYARHALSINTYDPGANFYYGQINLQLGNITDARDGFDIAALSGEYRGAAFTALSKIYFRLGDTEKSLLYANKSLDANANNVDAIQMVALISRLKQDQEGFTTALTLLKKLNPLNHFIRFESYRLDPTESTRKNFTSLIRNELPHETYLQLADWYFSLNLWKESLEVLNLAPPTPEVYYWKAYLQMKANGDGVTDNLNKATALSPELVFPFRSNSATVFDWVITQTPDWKPKYYLGLIHWSRNNNERARELFNQCGNPGFAPFYAAKASLIRDEQSADHLRTAGTLDPSEWRYGKLLVMQFIESKKYGEALSTAKEYHTRFPEDFRISMLLANTLLLNKQYKACSDLLDKTTILPYEGATDGRQLYREAWLMQAIGHIGEKKYKGAISDIGKSRLWPERLGVGMPYKEDIDSRLEDYLEGICYEKLKSGEEAKKKWNDVISSKANGNPVNLLITAFALKKTAKPDEGEKLLTAWVLKEGENKLAQWCLDVFRNNRSDVVLDVENNDNLRLVSELLTIK